MTAKTATPQRLYLLQLSAASVPLGDGRTMEMVSTAYLITMSDGSHILIDSGVPAGFQAPGTPGPAETKNDETKNVVMQLAELGLTPADVDIVITTHYDIDHIGFHDSFPQAVLIVQ